MRRLLAVFVLLFSALGSAQMVVKRGPIAAAAAGGSITFVTGQKNSLQSTTSNTVGTLAFPGNVTSGNSVIIGVVCFDSGQTPTISTPTKSAGTATVGTFTLDNTGLASSGGPDETRLAIYRVPITGTGSLTLSMTATNSAACGAVVAEYHGITAVDVTPSLSTGTSATESSGAITSAGGMIFMISSELSTGNFTYTQSDVSLAAFSTGASQYTYEAQHKITTAGSNTLTAGTGNSWFWGALSMGYK